MEADRCGLDLVGVQDHPYQWRFFDTWTLLAYAAGRTERVRLVPDVLNLPLRLPTLIAKSVASLDVEEALAILRDFWSGERSVRFEGEHYHVRAPTRRGHSPRVRDLLR